MRDNAEVWRLRRFSLTTALLLFAWTSAGVTLGSEPRFSPLGIQLEIARPELLPIGLALATLYGATRYFYYAFAIGPSPYRTRRDLLDALYVDSREMGALKSALMYWGPVNFSTRIWSDKRQEHEELGKQLSAAFPKFARARVVSKIEYSRQYDPEEGEYSSFGLSVVIPLRCRIAALFEDADYSSPVWFPAFAFGSWLVALLR